jgi:hypothetical protein
MSRAPAPLGVALLSEGRARVGAYSITSRSKPTQAAAAPFRANGQFGRQLDKWAARQASAHGGKPYYRY